VGDIDGASSQAKKVQVKVGCSAVVEFSLGDYAMASIKQDPYMKFLGVVKECPS
jgi:hypothetical protein